MGTSKDLCVPVRQKGRRRACAHRLRTEIPAEALPARRWSHAALRSALPPGSSRDTLRPTPIPELGRERAEV